MWMYCMESTTQHLSPIEKLTSNSEGAITGRAFTEGKVPVIHSMKKITSLSLPDFPT
jgi:hypothetical protein